MDLSYTFFVDYRDYSDYHFKPSLDIITNPFDHKLFHQDTIIFTDGKVECIDSCVRKSQNIPGILLLENNRTFGRTKNKKRLYYKCRPDDTKLPHFLVPYDLPMGFNKNFKNKYVTFQFDKWTDKHPYGILSQNLGDVYDYLSYCEYALYCKSLHNSITKSIVKCKTEMKNTTIEKAKENVQTLSTAYGTMLDRTHEYVFSIDPSQCLDRDDALSITRLENSIYKISVYITNVWIWLEYFDLWDFVGERVSTIYFPHTKRPMLPTIIGEELCSLDENKLCFGFVMDFYVHSDTISIHMHLDEPYKPTLNQCVFKVSQNYEYEETSMKSDVQYNLLLNVTKRLDININDSHEVVSYWMTQMNYHVAKLLKQNEIGIFRTVQSTNSATTSSYSVMPQFVKIMEQQIRGSYQCYEKNLNFHHEMLELNEYTHFTSPIRRMVDLLNQLSWMLHIIKPSNISDKAKNFYSCQIENIHILNEKMKSIKKVQYDCEILYKMLNNPQLLERSYEGIILSVLDKKCAFYIEELKWLTYIPTQSLYVKYMKVRCKLYMFDNEEQMKKKIRVQIMSL